MKLLVIHDQGGEIHLLAAVGSHVPGKVGFETLPGHSVTELEMPELGTTEDMDENVRERLRQIQTSFLVDRSADTAKLVPK